MAQATVAKRLGSESIWSNPAAILQTRYKAIVRAM